MVHYLYPYLCLVYLTACLLQYIVFYCLVHLEKTPGCYRRSPAICIIHGDCYCSATHPLCSVASPQSIEAQRISALADPFGISSLLSKQRGILQYKTAQYYHGSAAIRLFPV